MHQRSFSNSAYVNRSLEDSGCSAMSASAIPKLTSVPPQFDPFRSPQTLMSGHHANTSISAIFKSLKNSVDPDADHYVEPVLLHSHPTQNNTRQNSIFEGFPNRYPASNSNIRLGSSGFSRNNNSSLNNFGNHQEKVLQREGPAVVARTEGSYVHHGYQEVSIEEEEESYSVHTEDSDSGLLGGNLMSPTESDSFNQSLDKEACALFQWIIKPVPGVHAICVEGKKDLSDQNYWHSGIITRRISEKVVATTTGSVYRLVGNIELLDALSAGFPHKVIESFWLGFPTDWEQIISSYFRDHTLDRTDDTVSDDEVATLDEGAELNKETTVDDCDIVVTEDVNSEDDTNTEDTDDIATSQSERAPVVAVKAVQKPVKVAKKTMPITKDNVCVIENWTIKVLPSGKGICIMGSKPDGRVWNSSAIAQRLGRRRLQSTTGTIYKLQGNMYKLMALDTGLPEKVIKKFKKGFPKEWLELIQEHLHSTTEAKSKKTKAVWENKTTDLNTPASKKELVKTMSKSEPKISRRALSQPADQGAKRIRSEVKRKRSHDERCKQSRNSGVSNTSRVITILEPKKIVVTPCGQLLDTDTLGRSRSGRLIKPPLQWWAGQKLVSEGDVFRVHAPTVASQQFLSQFEERYHISSHKVKPFWNPREKGRDYSLNTSQSSANTSTSSQGDEPTTLDNQPPQSSKSKEQQKLCEQSSSTRGRKTCGTLGTSNLMKDTLKRLHAGKSKKSDHVSNDTRGAVRKASARAQLSNTGITMETEESSESEVEELRTRRSMGRPSRKSVIGINKELKGSDKAAVATQENIISSSTAEPELEDDKEEGEGVPVKKSANVIQTTRARRERSRVGKVELQQSVLDSTVDKVWEDNPKMLRRSLRACKRTLAIIEEDDSLSEDSKKVEWTGKAVQKGRNIKKRSMEKNTSEEAQAADRWTKEEKERLHDACQAHDPGNPLYWFKVAQAVATKSVEECTKMFFQDGLKPRSEKKKPPTKEKARGTSLTANVGTLKRKQQLKDLIQQSNENYEDDIFESTPLKAIKKRKLPILGMDDDGDNLYEEHARKQGKARFETPKGGDVGVSYIKPRLASARKTPASRVETDMLDQKRDVDGYVHRIMKRRLMNKKSKHKQGTPKPPKKVVSEEAIQQKLFHKFLTERKDDKENYVDPDQEEDYYWDEQLETSQ
ncbi:mis18-binding protein 1-like [Dreissena polymorpha]|uniref:SANT domain-containing protein n=1 Tax=Dreissena polymorpha TaxID=45954 RepID=A0A9D4L6I9_DREPO|nr:mis18-binding protein 1-like [Dreissena polymorpha]KAH3852937.1 hypothetical protein DPMN_095458 [Dreissena polymorpha]